MDKKTALAQYLGIEEDEIEDLSDDEFETSEGDYKVLTDEEADNECHDILEMYLDDMGLETFTPSFQDWIINNALDESEVEDFINSELDYFENIEPDTDMVEYLNSLTDLNSKINYIKDLYGDAEGFNDWAKDKLDIDKIAEEEISLDGRGHLISGYDGEEIELPGDLYAYRTN